MGHMFGGDPDYVGMDTPMPDMPGYKSTFKSFMPEEESRLNNLPGLNRSPLTQLEGFAGGTGDSPWAQAQLAAQAQAQGQAMGAAKANATSANTAALDSMAARGGLSTGAMQNMGRNSANNATMAGQGVIGQGLQQQGAIRSADEQNRLAALENLPGQEVQALQPELQKQSLWQQAASQNAQQQQQDAMGENAYNLKGYSDQIAKQAGREEATAQQKRGKK